MKKRFLSVVTACLLLFCGFIFAGCNEKELYNNVEVKTWYSQYGMVSGSGNFLQNTNVTITATAKSGYSFIAWIKDDVIVSKESTYIFISNEKNSGKYIAVFTCPDLEFINVNTQALLSNGLQVVSYKVYLGKTTETLKLVEDVTLEPYDGLLQDVNNNLMLPLCFDKTQSFYGKTEVIYRYFNTDIEDYVISSPVSTFFEITRNDLITLSTSGENTDVKIEDVAISNLNLDVELNYYMTFKYLNIPETLEKGIEKPVIVKNEEDNTTNVDVAINDKTIGISIFLISLNDYIPAPTEVK